MTTKPFNLLDHEAKAMSEGRLGVIVRPVSPQPWECGFGKNPEVHPYCTGTEWPLAYYQRRGSCWNSSSPLDSPFDPRGTTLEFREEWYCDIDLTADPAILPDFTYYKADSPTGRVYDLIPECEAYEEEPWQSADSMPPWAIRFRATVGEVRCKRVQGITEEEAELSGVSGCRDGSDLDAYWISAREAFGNIFNSIHGPGSWEANPWLWLCEIEPKTK